MPRSSVPKYHGSHLDLDYEPFGASEVSAIIEYVGLPLAALVDEDQLRTNLCQLARYHHLQVQVAATPTAAADREYLEALNRTASRLIGLMPLNELPNGASADEFQAEPSFGIWRLLETPLLEEMHAQLEQEQLASLRSDEARANLASAGDATIRQRPPRIDLSITAEELFGSAYGKDLLIRANQINSLIAAAAKRALAEMEQAGKSEAPGTNERICVRLMKLYREAFDREVAFSRDFDSQVVGGPMIRFVSKCCEALGIQLAPGSIAKFKQEHFQTESDDPS